MNKRKGAKDTRGTAARLLSYIGQYKVRFIIVICCIVMAAITTALASLFIQSLIDDYIMPLVASDNPDFAGLLRYLLRMAAIFACGVVAALLYNRIMVTIAQGILKKIRDEMFEHMQGLPIRYFDTHTHGDLMSRYTNDTDALRQMMTQSIPQVMNSCITVVVVFVSMLTVSLWLTLVVIAFVFIIMLVIRKIAGGSARYFMKQQIALGKENGFIEEMINGQKVIKVFCHEEQAKEDFDKVNDELCDSATKANTYANILMPIMNNIGFILYVVIAIVGGFLGIAGVRNISLTGIGILTLGAIVSFLQLSRSFVNPISQISNQINFIVMALAGAERIFELLDEEVEQDGGTVTMVRVRFDEDGNMVECPERTKHWAWKVPQADGSFKLVEMKGHVEFDHVDFGYNPEKTVLHDITLYAQPGEKVALVGATGAGKTTITNLINRFYDIQRGSITYDGIDIADIEKPSLRRSLGVVLQDVNLFTGTVMDNIRYGKLDATDEDCIAAAKLANADGFIRMLPHGYDTVLEGDGSGLSQGQRQLISIARAAVADPPVMILDEATSSIDTRTEAIVQRGMDALMDGRTVFVIAHRLSTIMNSDVIMVLDQGRIIERGNHDKLIEEKGTYYQLYTGAFELE
ncbi:MAG: ABC transporter ATP-binding protein/permease [Lachnospiraceae bacterium]|nr:ABC transporter ATP-binding protein/permease [Lachnospiraceae bacterium]